MKIAPIYRASLNHPEIYPMIIHTGQHYDQEMSDIFFQDLGIPEPSFHLNAGSGSHAIQTSRIMTVFEGICEKERPDIVMVVGDVNSTLACTIVAKKLNVKVAHVEAGLRSFDMSMPEEINRMVTDSITDYFFVTEKSGVRNLIKEGKPEDRIHYVGHVMIDNLLYQVAKLDGTDDFQTAKLKKKNKKYAFLTLHRPSNVDNRDVFEGIAEALNEITQYRPICFPVHPRTKKMIAQHGINLSDNIISLPPLSFKESLFLWKDAEVVLTDSGGLQEETTALKIPCVTIRENTERPITVDVGSNVLAGTNPENILKAYRESILKSRYAMIPHFWDGKASERIWQVLINPTA